MRSLYTWFCICVTASTAAAGDVLIARAMRRVGDLGDLHRRHGLCALIAHILSSGFFSLESYS